MTASAHRPHFHPSQSDYFAREILGVLDVEPDDRIGPRPRRRIGRLMLRLSLVAGLAAAGYAHYDDPQRLPRWSADVAAVVAPLLERAAPLFAQPPSPPTTGPDGAAPGTSTADVAEMPPAEAKEIAPTPAVAAVAPEPDESPDEATDEAPDGSGRSPPAGSGRAPSARDAMMARAAAAGLNPTLSRVLLARLSDADYAAAGVAIRKALAETPDDQELVWPQKEKTGVARFRIHFVAGAEPDCRRYVVTIAKDGWLTTALPMDHCSQKPAAATRE